MMSRYDFSVNEVRVVDWIPVVHHYNKSNCCIFNILISTCEKHCKTVKHILNV